ncbi:DUF2953 domain-containing protein [Chloroflexota bacterium]
MWIIAALAGLAVLIIFALSVPLDLELRIDVYDRPKFRMRLSWFFGLVSKEIAKKEKKPKEKKAIKGKHKPRKREPGARTMLEILRTKGLVGQIKLLLKGILRIPRIEDLAADLKVGLGDPADTGLLFALIGPTTSFLGSSFLNKIKVQPSFADEAILEGSLHGVLRLWPIQTVTPLLRFIFSLPTLRVAKILVVTKWKRKK